MPRLTESERQDRIRARRRLRAALACLDDDLPCLSPARLFLEASIHTIDAVVGTDDDVDMPEPCVGNARSVDLGWPGGCRCNRQQQAEAEAARWVGQQQRGHAGDHDEDNDRYGVADGWHPKDGAAEGAVVPVEPFQSAGLRLPSRGDCRGSYVADHHEREC
jgi:hypothetical protein